MIEICSAKYRTINGLPLNFEKLLRYFNKFDLNNIHQADGLDHTPDCADKDNQNTKPNDMNFRYC